MIKLNSTDAILEYSDIDYSRLTDYFSKIEVLNVRKRGYYYNDFFTMDIETSTINKKSKNPIAFTYSIAVHIANETIIFRTWSEYMDFIGRLTDHLGLHEKNTLVCYVHNLPYEFQFMRNFMNISEVFATQKRKVIKCRAEGIEYRCSYKLTNMSLENYTKKTPNVIHNKLSGNDFNYNKVRTPTTFLTIEELQYIYNDVVGLYEALTQTIFNDGYTIKSIPITSTGFVRNELRTEMKKNPNNYYNFIETRLNQETYGLLRECRRGGNTHCNPIWSNQILYDLVSFDMSSAYPAVMIQCKYPITKFITVKETQLKSVDRLADEYACIITIELENVSAKTLSTVPYIAKAKCSQLIGVKSDNGRVLSATKLTMVVTDIDYKIIKRTYNIGKITFTDCKIAQYGYLPNELRNQLLKQYYNKTTLKDKDEYLYNKEKNKFNANFGCMLTDICQDTVEYNPFSEEPFTKEKTKSYQELLDAYYNNRRSFLSYQHGVWVTAHCRNRLQQAIEGLKRDMVYCDTDSAKFFDSSVNRLLFENLNKGIQKEIEECGLDCTVEYNGKEYTLGLWELDGEYEEFKSMGAKKYCYTQDGEFSITVAGLSKSMARKWLIKHGGIKAFKPKTIVPKRHSGRTSAHYNDWTHIKTITVNGEKIQVGSNVAILDATYEFGLSEDYENLLEEINNYVMY